MKTTLTSLLILSALIFGSFGFLRSTESVCTKLEQAIDHGYEAANAGEWNTAEQIFSTTQSVWEKDATFLAIFTHHNMLDEIQNALSRVIATTKNHDITALGLEYATLKDTLSTLRHSDTPELKNVF